jgi:hypothetical protein
MVDLILIVAALANFTAVAIPGEGTPVIEIKTSSVKVFSKPSQEADVVELMKVEAPAVIPWRSGFTRTVKAGILQMRANSLAKTYDFGDIAHLSGAESWSNRVDVLFNQGERLEYLLYLGEGICVLRRERAVMATELCQSLFDSDSPAELLSQPVYELWFDISVGDAPAKWLMLEPGITEWLCTQPYNCEEK